MLRGIKLLLHSIGFYDEPTPTPKRGDKIGFSEHRYFVCPECGNNLITKTEYEIHQAVDHGVQNGYDKIFYHSS